MDISGRPREGWITLIPLALLVLFVIVAMGGPAAFVNTVALWVSDLLDDIATWLHWM